MAIPFDEALDVAVIAIREFVDASVPITFVRDVAGRLTAVLDDGVLEDQRSEQLANSLHERLGRFSPGPSRVLLRRSDLIDQDDVLKSPDRVGLSDKENVWLVDRLLTNQVWLREADAKTPTIPIATAFSLKGGVGRSTALAVWAWYLARQGHKVIAIDLDLEAPGLGSILIDQLPNYGLADWLVESLVEDPTQELLGDCIARSPVADQEPGVVYVLPAFGEKTRDYVAKVGRAFLPSVTASGEETGLAERVRSLLAALASRDDRLDAVLLDSRAGLHDIGAAAVTQLHAEVFIFARDEPQSWAAYRLLFQHLSRSKSVSFGMPEHDLRWRLKMVAAQLDKTEDAVVSWIEGSYDAWSALYDDEDRTAGANAAQTFSREDPSGPHYPLMVYFDQALRGLGLAERSQRPRWDAIQPAFEKFCMEATARLLGDGQNVSRPKT